MKKVKDIMTSNHIMHCIPETKLQSVAKTMKESNLGSLPVIDKDNKVIGIITDRDVCLAFAAITNNNPAKKS